MAYTIKGLAKVNECETYDADGLARIWDYWLVCNSCDKQSVNDFKRLRIKERGIMLHFLQENGFDALGRHIVKHIYD